MIEARHLTKYYGPHPAITDVCFRVEKGEILGFLGPNGAGKSTTMRILAGCLAASEGTASIAGCDVFERSLDARRSLGYLPEQVPLYPEMKVHEYLTFAGLLHGMAARALKPRLEVILERCGLLDVRHKLIGRLSKGYRQRVGIAQAMLHNPPVLILDEPTVGLDPRQIIEVRELIRSLAGDHTVLLSTHILAEVSMVCTRVAIIHRGRVVADDTIANLTGTAGSNDTFTVEVAGQSTLAEDLLRAVPGVAAVAVSKNVDGGAGAQSTTRFSVRTLSHGIDDSSEIRSAAAGALVNAGCGLLEMRAERTTLEDVFVRLTTGDAP
jgi:ABC-2 type transport system ATP-binding protein